MSRAIGNATLAPGADHPSIGFTAVRRVVFFIRPMAADCDATAMTIGQRRRGVGVDVLPDGSVHARVWAPYARSVAVVIEDGPGAHSEPVALTSEERGYFSGFLPAAGPGTRYRLRLDDEQTLVADPASRWQPEGVYGSSMVVDPAAFAWEVDAWQVPPFRDWVLYELHVGTFTPEGTFEAIIPRLPYLKD